MYAPKNESKEFEMCPTGWQTAVCSRVIDVGTHWNEGKQKFQRKIMIGFESQHLMKEGEFAGEPFLLFANFNYSMYQNAHLCKFIENWRAKRFASQDMADRFDLAKLLTQKAFINVVRSDDNKYTNIQTIGPVPDGMTAPEIRGKTILIDQNHLDMKEVEKLSEKMKERILSAEERKTVNQPVGGYDERNPPPYNEPIALQPGYYDDDIPF